MKKISFFALSFLMTGIAGISAHAEGIQADQKIERIVAVNENPDGTVEVIYGPAERVAPGEELVYTITFTNSGTEAAENVVLNMPVEEQVTYIEGSSITRLAAVAFSADGGATFANRSELFVVDGDSPRPALAEEITNVRWTLNAPLAAGASGEVSMRAKLN